MKRNALLVACLTLTAAGLLYLVVPKGPRVSEDNLVIRGPSPRAVDTRGCKNNQRYEKEYQFRTEWFSRHIPVWEKCLEDFQGKPDVHYLEIGLYEGRSAFWMLENVLTHPTARLTGIDLFAEDYLYAPNVKGAKEVFYDNLMLSGLERKATIIQGFSQVELRKLPVESFDIIYIDGSHKESDVLEDAILCWRLLKGGGMLILDDYLLHTTGSSEKPKLAIDTFLFFFGEHFELVHLDWQVFLKKKPKSNPSP